MIWQGPFLMIKAHSNNCIFHKVDTRSNARNLLNPSQDVAQRLIGENSTSTN